uniref:FAT domain-containing protein n=1 Tax=Heterorhabditis bacteriophora TaxID=37862 RepID=A0A1I7XRW4_HETBA
MILDDISFMNLLTIIMNGVAGTSQLNEDIQKDISCTETLLQVGEEFHRITDMKLQRKLRCEMLAIIRTIIDLKYESLVRADAQLMTSTFDDHRQQLTFIFTCLDESHHVEPLETDFVKWIMAKFLRSRTSSTLVNHRFGGFLQEKILHLTGFLNRDEKDIFLKHIVLQLALLVRGALSFSLCDQPSNSQYNTVVQLTSVYGSRSTAYHAVLDIIRHGIFRFECLSLKSLQMLWSSLVRICSVGTFSLKTTCVLLFQRLLSLDLGNHLACRLVFDILVSNEELIFSVGSNMMLDGMETLKQSHTHRFEIVLTTITEILSRLDPGLDDCKNDELRLLADYTQKLIERLINSNNEDSMCVVKKLSSYYSYLLMIDSATMSNDRSSWLVSISEFRSCMLLKSSRHDEAIKIKRMVTSALARCHLPNTKAVLAKVLPTQQQLIEVIEATSSMEETATSVLLTVLGLVSDMTHHLSNQLAVSVAFLSLPWLTDPHLQLESKRHFTSIPLLKEMTRLAKLCGNTCTDAVRECTLAALSYISDFCDWRRTILLSALGSGRPSLVQVALSHLAMFVSSLDTPSFSRLISPALSLVADSGPIRSKVDIACILNAVSHSLCATHRDTVVDASSITCRACQKLLNGSENLPEQDKLPEPNGLLDLLIKLLSDPVMVRRTEKQIRLDTAALIFSTLSHVNSDNHLFLRMVISSLNFITDEDEDVRNCYQLVKLFKGLTDAINSLKFNVSFSFRCSFKVIVARDPPSSVVNSIEEQFSSQYDSSYDETVMDASSPFLAICARYSKNTRLALWAFRELLIRALRFLDSPTLLIFRTTKTLIRDLTELEFPIDKDTKRFFARRRKALCDDFAVELLSIGDRFRDCNTDDLTIPPTETVDAEIDIILHSLQTLFGFDSIIKFSSCAISSSVIVSSRFQYFPCVLENPLSKTQKKTLKAFIQEYCGLNQDEQSYLDLLTMISQCHTEYRSPFSITGIMQMNCEYLGFLLSFRRCLLDDDHFEQRPVLLASLATIIRLLEQKFLEDTSNKMLVVLRAATSVGEGAIALWAEFVRRLSAGNGAKFFRTLYYSESFERTAMVLVNNSSGDSSRIDSYLKRTCRDESPDKIIRGRFLCFINYKMSCTLILILGCVRMLMEECDTVGRVVLQKLLSILDGSPIDDTLAAQLVPALLHTLRSCSEGDLRVLASRCLGRMGAVDPGRLGLSAKGETKREKSIVFVDENKLFYVDLLERCWRVYASVLDADLIDMVEYSLQTLLTKLVGKNDQDEIMPLPLVDHTNSYEEWLLQCFIAGVPKVRQYPSCEVFKALKWIAYAKDAVFTRHMLPQLIILLILENNEQMIDEYCKEMVSVLRRVLERSSCGWVQLAAHVVFSVMDTLERYTIHRLAKRRLNDRELERTYTFMSRVFDVSLPDGSLLVVAAAEKCQCLLRALRWCEQYAIKKDIGGADIFDRNHFYTLENLDGVLGAFECISANTTPTPDERILALEANGDYNEALPLYSLSADNKELRLIKCLLRLNQPQLALSTAVSIYEQSVEEDALRSGLEASQLEAAWHLRDWSRLEKMVQTRDPLSSGADSSWGAACASILCAVKRREPLCVSARLLAARQQLVDRITAMTIEDSDTYAQAYKYISHLHVLEEIDESCNSLALLSDSTKIDLKAILSKWQARSDSAEQCASILEPILRVRRELLRATSRSGINNAVSQLLIQSCRLARQAGHLQIAWTFLVEAKALDVNHKDVDMEEARVINLKRSDFYPS